MNFVAEVILESRTHRRVIYSAMGRTSAVLAAIRFAKRLQGSDRAVVIGVGEFQISPIDSDGESEPNESKGWYFTWNRDQPTNFLAINLIALDKVLLALDELGANLRN